MQGKNGHAAPVKAAACKNCQMAIVEPGDAIFDGEDWFCDARCHGQWISAQGGNVPA